MQTPGTIRPQGHTEPYLLRFCWPLTAQSLYFTTWSKKSEMKALDLIPGASLTLLCREGGCFIQDGQRRLFVTLTSESDKSGRGKNQLCCGPPASPSVGGASRVKASLWDNVIVTVNMKTRPQTIFHSSIRYKDVFILVLRGLWMKQGGFTWNQIKLSIWARSSNTD